LEHRTLARPEKKALSEQRTIVWVDESSFYLLPMAVRTWAPQGCTPVLSVPLTRDHLSAISGVTPDGRLFLQVRPQSYDSQGVIRFLQVLLRKVPGKLLIIWDGSPIHRSHAIRTFLATGAAKRIHLERIPAYAPDCNPDEGVWNYLKRVELANVCCRNLVELEQEVIKARERLRHKREVLRACSRQAGYLL
jgi:transposase